MIDEIKKYNIEAMLNRLENVNFLTEEEANEVFSLFLEKTNRLVKSCNSGINNIACIKLKNYKDRIRKVLDKYNLGHVFKNRVNKLE